LRQAVEGGLPVYAECGGAMYLGNAIEVGGSTYPMVGVFPLVFRMHKRPQGHGYTLLEVDKKNPYFEVGTHLKGHEFHYSRVVSWGDDDLDFVCRVKRGWGFDGRREGLCHKGAQWPGLPKIGSPGCRQPIGSERRTWCPELVVTAQGLCSVVFGIRVE